MPKVMEKKVENALVDNIEALNENSLFLYRGSYTLFLFTAIFEFGKNANSALVVTRSFLCAS